MIRFILGFIGSNDEWKAKKLFTPNRQCVSRDNSGKWVLGMSSKLVIADMEYTLFIRERHHRNVICCFRSHFCLLRINEEHWYIILTWNYIAVMGLLYGLGIILVG